MFNDKYGLTEAVLQGRKTMTRRMISNDFPTEGVELIGITGIGAEFRIGENYEPVFVRLPYKVGEVVAIAQSYKDVYDSIKNPCELFSDRLFNSLLKEHKGWTNKMFVKAEFMPHRIRITDLKIERLQDISDEDCLKEGVKQWTRFTYSVDGIYYDFIEPREAFAALIDKVSVRGTWETNPWVVAYSYELVK